MSSKARTSPDQLCPMEPGTVLGIQQVNDYSVMERQSILTLHIPGA